MRRSLAEAVVHPSKVHGSRSAIFDGVCGPDAFLAMGVTETGKEAFCVFYV